MNVKKCVAAITACTVIYGVALFSGGASNELLCNAYTEEGYEEEHTEGVYGSLSYNKYSDHIKITGCIEEVINVAIPSVIDGLPVTVIGAAAFSSTYTDKLKSVIIPDSITEIEYVAFAGCGELESIDIPDSVVSIGPLAFSGTGLRDVSIGKGLDCIINDVFYGCNELTTIVFPENINEICGYALSGEKIESVYILNSECEIWGDMYAGGRAIHVSDECIIYGYPDSTAQKFAEECGYNFSVITPLLSLGDIDGDNAVNASDASMVLAEYAIIATGGTSSFTDEQIEASDVNKDGTTDASDASSILGYYAYTATGGSGSIEEYLS